jgi:hypothetical protein
MDRPTIKSVAGPAEKLQESLRGFLELRGWLVLQLHGNQFQRGFPRFWASHQLYRQRWVHPKLDSRYTAAQIECFPKISAFGSGIWVLGEATDDEYGKLWQPPNWTTHRGSGDIVTTNRVTESKSGKERQIQNEVIDYLKLRDWFVMETHGNMYQRGLPDLWATHTIHGQRWIEIKQPTQYCFTPAQLKTFPEICTHGSGVWVMTAANQWEYAKLFGHHNWYGYFTALGQKTPSWKECFDE